MGIFNRIKHSENAHSLRKKLLEGSFNYPKIFKKYYCALNPRHKQSLSKEENGLITRFLLIILSLNLPHKLK